ncbi:hypothetical protein LCGC14_1056750 [marine sediment metagenome]
MSKDLNKQKILLNPNFDKTLDRFTLFAIMWVLAVFFHMIHRSDIVSGIVPVLTVLAGVYVLLDPSKDIRLILFSALHVGVYLIHAPNTSNHAFFAFCVDMTILLVYGFNYLKSNPDRKHFFWKLNPIIKWFTIILYFFAVFHKLNSNYLDPSSCGGSILIDRLLNNKAAVSILGVISADTIQFLKYFNIYSSLLLEMLIPILLLHRKFAWLGCFLGIVLHATLGFVYFWHFTPLLYALYVLFLPDVFYTKIFGLYRNSQMLRKGIKYSLLSLFVIIPILFVSSFYFPIIENELGNFSRNSGRGWALGINIRTFIGWLPFLVYTSIFTYFVVLFARGSQNKFIYKLPLAYYLFPVTIILNGFSPYLGFKTHQSFSMFSGVLTHGTTNNHLFMPTINILNTQEDVVTPFPENHTNYDQELNWKNDEKMVYYELQKRVTELHDKGISGINLHYWRNGNEVYIENAETNEELIIPLNWVDKKFRIYREIPTNPYGCYY